MTGNKLYIHRGFIAGSYLVGMAKGKHIHTAEQEKEPAGEPPPLRSRLWAWTGFGDKTLWEWVQLLSSLAMPIVLAIAGFLFTATQERSGREIEEQRAQEAALQAYLEIRQPL